MIRTNRFIQMFAAATTLAAATACGSVEAAPLMSMTSSAAADPGVEALRASLVPYGSLAIAKGAGYSTAITDCLSNGDEGAMGMHFGKPALIDGTLDPLHPESIIYEPGTNGEMSLVGVEFLVPFSAVPKTAPAPMLFGQKFMPNETYGVWGLHVWTQRSNPKGTFAMWNPRVHC